MKVTSKKTISFPKLNWGVNAGEERELPEDKDAQKIILDSPYIEKVGKSSGSREVEPSAEKENKEENK